MAALSAVPQFRWFISFLFSVTLIRGLKQCAAQLNDANVTGINGLGAVAARSVRAQQSLYPRTVPFSIIRWTKRLANFGECPWCSGVSSAHGLATCVGSVCHCQTNCFALRLFRVALRMSVMVSKKSADKPRISPQAGQSSTVIPAADGAERAAEDGFLPHRW